VVKIKNGLTQLAPKLARSLECRNAGIELIRSVIKNRMIGRMTIIKTTSSMGTVDGFDGLSMDGSSISKGCWNALNFRASKAIMDNRTVA
jgi:hypothetical protein